MHGIVEYFGANFLKKSYLCFRFNWFAEHRKHLLYERSYSVSVELPSINEIFPGLQQLHQDGEKAHVV